MGTPEDLLAEIASRGDEVVALCRRLIQAPTENPPGDVSGAAALTAEALRSWGIDPAWHEPSPGRVSLVAAIGPQSGRTLILNGHLDVVPAGDPSRWTHPPFSGDVLDGFIWGRGSVDMKGGVAALLGAVHVLTRVDLPGRIILVLVADEETGGRWGTRWLLEQTGLRGDGCLIAEPSGPEVSTIGQRGALWLRLRACGTPAHGSLSPYVGRNALVSIMDALRPVMDLAGRRGNCPPELAPILAESKRWMASHVGESATAALDHVTVNLGVLRGGTKINVVPEEATAEVDIRVPLGCSTSALRAELTAALEGTGVEVETLDLAEPNFTLPDAHIAGALAAGVTEILGKPPAFLLQWATSDARHFRAAGIPVVQYGPFGRGIHGYDEAVPADEVVRCAQVYAATAWAFLRSRELPQGSGGR
ncbi:MAG: ArgE/DapE family deacylase [Armatimonadota bacterium]|nr:ArgE/DapE family deacylase [Armatimonadota bacterium]MDR7426303.1 ArgE/DapE family deacylase [Armatimonadota bacterium]MDR7463270.1 ArgE/DapE family deacylase [Armatimonadota bacterium]MDR7470984.1 ArgE/DapE family deacylase [Armatimonadota bacterium]MDR7474722.1 ArgE/DapE family deacylase [Armatimonadota bacterium]